MRKHPHVLLPPLQKVVCDFLRSVLGCVSGADWTHSCRASHRSCVLHAVDLVVIHELFEVVQVVPPLEEEGLSDEAEPGCDQQLLALRLVQHLLQLLLAHVAVGFDLVGVWTQLHILLHEEDVVDLMFSPNTV